MRRRFTVRGVVQGVNFRNTAVAEARKLGVTGRVWNQADGAVGCVAEADPAVLERFAEWLRRGPRGAHVEGLEADDAPGDPRYTDFRISWGAAE